MTSNFVDYDNSGLPQDYPYHIYYARAVLVGFGKGAIDGRASLKAWDLDNPHMSIVSSR